MSQHPASGEPVGDPALLENAAVEAKLRGFHRFPIVDVDAHHFEMESWRDIAKYVEHPAIRRRAMQNQDKRPGAFDLIPPMIGDQFVAGRLKRDMARNWEEGPVPAAIRAFKHGMDQIGVDYSILFPTTMLTLGLHPQVDVEVAIAHAYARWVTEEVLAHESSIKSMLYLPFNDPEASLKLIEQFADRPGVVGFMVTSLRYQPVHDKRFLPIYAALEERGLPLAFHPIYNWQERALEQFNRFISVHALGFPLYNMIHLTNIVINGIPERFPNLKFIWMEAGVAWISFMMQRLDSEYMMRPSEAPLLTKRPSDYMRDFYYTTQPLEYPNNTIEAEFLEVQFRLIDAERTLLFSSDYPHWDFDLPSRIYDLPFLREEAKRRILGGNAMELFQLPMPQGMGEDVPAS